MLKIINVLLGVVLCFSVLISGCSPENNTTTTQPVAVEPVSEEISWDIGETTVAATITRPNDKAVHPAIVLIPGSGPTDRDWNSSLLPGTNGSARLLAVELARLGFVTIRYDKRFTGPNAAKNLPLLKGKISLESHIEEVSGAVTQLMARAEVDKAQIFALANSEGCIHAMNYQLQREPRFAGLILTGAPGQSMSELMRTQLSAQVAALPDAAAIMAGYDKLMAAFLAGQPFVAEPSLPSGINQLILGFYEPMNLPFTSQIFTVDSTKLLEKITAPVLVVIGKKDIQVDYLFDGSRLEAAVKGHTNVQFSYPENANHVLKYEAKPRTELSAADAVNYNAADKVIDTDALKTIGDWLKTHLK